MRQTISGLVAAIAVVAASAAPAMACGGLFGGGCSPCGYASPCAQTYVPVYSGCNTGCGGWSYHERLPDPVQQYGVAPVASPQYYYVDQGPTYSGPGNFAPYPAYEEGGVSGWSPYRHHHHYYGYGYTRHHSMRYGYFHHYGHFHHYGYREHVLRRYY
ncbi:MAG: hypothetical protein ACLQDM_32080 [Bradyrhizobium sp.]